MCYFFQHFWASQTSPVQDMATWKFQDWTPYLYQVSPSICNQLWASVAKFVKAKVHHFNCSIGNVAASFVFWSFAEFWEIFQGPVKTSCTIWKFAWLVDIRTAFLKYVSLHLGLKDFHTIQLWTAERNRTIILQTQPTMSPQFVHAGHLSSGRAQNISDVQIWSLKSSVHRIAQLNTPKMQC